jgi:hypothetical protein
VALIDLIQQQLDDSTISQLSQQLGADPNTTREAIPAALSAVLGGLSKNAQQPGGDQALAGVLGGHDGSLLDSLGSLLGNAGALQGDGGGILGQIFGHHQPAVQSQVSQSTGLDAGQAGKLLMLLAPIVLGYLSRQHQQGAGGGLMDILNGERQQTAQAHPQHAGILDQLLDRNHDGSILDDVAGLAGGFLGGR